MAKVACAAILYRNTDRADGFARYPHRRNAVRLRRNTGHRLNPPQKQLSVASVFCVGCCVLRPAGGIDRRRPYPVIAVSATFNHIPFKKESLTMSTSTTNNQKIKDSMPVVLRALINVVISFASSVVRATDVTILLLPVLIELLEDIVSFIIGTKVK